MVLHFYRSNTALPTTICIHIGASEIERQVGWTIDSEIKMAVPFDRIHQFRGVRLTFKPLNCHAGHAQK